MATISEYLNQLVRDKQKLVEYFTNQGFELTGNETITEILNKCTNSTCTHENKHQVGTWNYTGNFNSYCYSINYECQDCSETFSTEVQHSWSYRPLVDGLGIIEGIEVSCVNGCGCSREIYDDEADFDYYYNLYLESGE